ncbi:MAG: hypothetical protein F6K39_45935, partial [Okeania sp. SIO3B3]|nr:hypothetical protein [Okeania sp. SIO3B3]
VRGFTIIILTIIMFGSSPFDRSMRALHQLKVPQIIINIILFTYRYIFLYLENLRKMKTALILRGYENKSTYRSIKIASGLILNLLLRSYEQTERIYNAMFLRGYEGRFYSHYQFKKDKGDVIKTIVTFIIALTIIGLQLLI